MTFQFTSYDAADVERCANAFAVAVRELLKAQQKGCSIGTSDWTQLVLDWFASSARKDLIVDAKPPRVRGRGRPTTVQRLIKDLTGGERETRGESLFDLTHSDYPQYDDEYGSPEYWKKALGAARRTFLVLESEWAKQNSSGSTFGMVMEDAAKLAHVAATAKVVIFGSHKSEQRSALFDCAELMAQHDHADTTWLWFDVPWDDRCPEFKMFRGRA